MTNIFLKLAISSFLAAQGLSSAAFAEDDKDEKKDWTLYDESKNEELFSFSSDFPDSPALALSGIDVSNTTSVGELRKFALSLPSTFDGENKNALALDMSPAAIFFPIDGQRQTLKQYAVSSSKAERLARRSKVSVVVRDGTENEDDADKSIKSLVALGASTSFFDDSDPLMALAERTQITGRDGSQEVCIDIMEKQAAAYVGQTVFSQDLTDLRTSLGDVQITLNLIASGIYEGDVVAALASAKDTINKDRAALVAIRAASDDPDKLPKLTKPAELNGPVDGENADARAKRLAANAVLLRQEAGGLEGDVEALAELPKVPKKVLDAWGQCQNSIKHSLRMGKALDFGAATLWRGDPSGLSDLENDGAAVWLSAKKGLWSRCGRNGYVTNSDKPCTGKEPYVLVGLSGRMGFDETVSTGNDDLKESESDNWQAWAGVEYYSDRLRAAARFGYSDTEFNKAEAEQFSKSGEKWLLSADYRVTETTWVSVSYGEAAGSIDALDGETLKVTVKFSEPSKLNIFGLN